MKIRLLIVIFLIDLYARLTICLKPGGRGKLLNSLGQTVPTFLRWMRVSKIQKLASSSEGATTIVIRWANSHHTAFAQKRA
jgi:hypothetical protein